MKIKVTRLYVDDQEKALRFYTEVLGFIKKADFTNGSFRWLTVAPSDEANETELQLVLNDSPAAKAYQQSLFQQNESAIMLDSDDIEGECKRLKERGAEFVMPPTEVTGATIARLYDQCGNLIQISQLKRW